MESYWKYYIYREIHTHTAKATWQQDFRNLCEILASGLMRVRIKNAMQYKYTNSWLSISLYDCDGERSKGLLF